MGGKIIERDRGFKRIMRAIHAAKGKSHVSVGILQNEEKHEGSPYTVAEIAAVHEFGSDDGKIPQRSFIRSTYDEQLQQNIKLVQALQKDVLLGKRSKQNALAYIGEVVSKQMVEKINSRTLTPLKSKTAKQKKSSTPLVDTGRLKGSISFEVVK